ncbi:MAG: ATP-binding protein [Candidatus Saccharimonadales bacterium]
MLCIGLVPTLVVSIFAYITISTQLKHKTEEQLTSIVVKQEQKINALLQGKQEDVLKLANRYDLQLAISDYYNNAAKDPAAINAVLLDKKVESPDIQAIYISNPDDMVYAYTSNSDKGKKAPVGISATQSGQRNVISIQEDPKDGIEKLFIATRMSVNQKDVGTLILVYKTDDFAAAIQDYNGLGTTGETIITVKDADGNALPLFPLRFDSEAALNPHVPLNSLQILANPNSIYSNVVDYRNHRVIVAARSVGFTNWGLATKLDIDEAYAPIAQLRNTLTVIVATSSALIIIVALSFTRLFTRPIVALTEKTRSIMYGDFTQRIAVTSKDEIGTLGSTFNDMANKLDESYSALENKVTERTQALNQKVKELGTANAKDEAILSSIGEGLVVTDKNGTILLVNAIAADLMELDPGTTSVGKSVDEWQAFDDNNTTIPPEKRPVRVALTTGKKVEQHMVVLAKDGAKRTLGVTASPVIQNGQIIGAIKILRDTTKEREVDRMKTEFISLASHQLRTPLSAIRWFSEMLMSGDAGKLNADQQEFAQNVYGSAVRMIELVSSLLNISRIESGRIIIDPQPTDLKELVGGIVNDLKAKIEERHQNLIISVHADLPKIRLDRRLISQVYLNLLSNAIKYTPKGGEISVFVSHKDDKIISQVTDNGYGIPASEQPKMFQKFFRATNIVKVETDGTGLGMYLIKSIVDSSGGEIWFKSEEGKGTTFWFSLPASGMIAKAGEVTIE